MEQPLDAHLTDEEIQDLRPTKMKRIFGSLIDGIAVFALWFAGFSFTMFFDTHSNALNWFFMIAPLFFEPINTSLGGSIGQRLMGMRVVQYAPFQEDQSKLNLTIFSAITRYFFKLVLGYKSWWTMFFSDYQRTRHDQISKSVLIRV